MIKIFEITPHTLLFLTQEGLDISFLISINKVPTNRLFRSVGTFIRDFSDKRVTHSVLFLYLTCVYLLCFFAAVSVLRRSIVIVIGPTPPGTGVM